MVHTAGMKGNGLKEPPLRQLRGRGARRAPWEMLSLQLPQVQLLLLPMLPLTLAAAAAAAASLGTPRFISSF